MNKYKLYMIIGISSLVLSIGTTFAYYIWKSSTNALVNLNVCTPTITFAGGSTINGVDMIPVLTKEDGTRPLLIAVTQLTSTSQERMEKELLINKPIEDVVMHYAENTQKAGLDGVVCSPLEVQAVKQRCGKDFITVTPGIRFAAKDAGDQVRITTPAKAKELGSDYIVVGRPITQAEDPVQAYKLCKEQFC